MKEEIHSFTQEPSNRARARRVRRYVLSYARKHYQLKADRENYEMVLKDILTDFCHWMSQHDIDIQDAMTHAQWMFEQEDIQEKEAEAEASEEADSGN